MEVVVGVFLSSPSLPLLCCESVVLHVGDNEVQTSYVLLAVDANFPLASMGVCTSAYVIRGDHVGRSICIASSNGACFTLFL